MTDLTEILKSATEAGAASDLAKDARVALRTSCAGLSYLEIENLRFSIPVVRGMKNRGGVPATGWKPELQQYLAVLEPLSLSALGELARALDAD